jgi:hypothetical protein
MSFQLPVDCLNEIIEHLEKDIGSLRSCSLVDRSWCTIAIRILWRNIWDFDYHSKNHAPLSILSTLNACLPNESKNLLSKNEIFIPMPTPKSPLFNYISFIKTLSLYEIEHVVEKALVRINRQLNTSENNHLILQELFKAFMSQISSLKVLGCTYTKKVRTIPFVSFPGAKDCLTDISEVQCLSNLYSNHLHQLSQICHNIRSLSVVLKDDVSDRLKELISSQHSLKSLGLIIHEDTLGDVTPTLSKHHDAITRLLINIKTMYQPVNLSFVNSIKNLQEIVILTPYPHSELQHMILPNLQTFRSSCYSHSMFEPFLRNFTKFLANNRKPLTDLYVGHVGDESLSRLVIQYCPNLEKLFIIIHRDDLDMLKTAFNDDCQYLQSIVIWWDGEDYIEEEYRILLQNIDQNLYKLEDYF